MYLTRREVAIAPGRGAEFEAWWAEGQQALKAEKGFRLATLSNSLGYPSQYTALIRYDTREDWQAAQSSEAFRARLKHRPEGLVIGHPRPTEAYELVHRVGPDNGQAPAAGHASFGTLAEWNIKGPAAAEFESSRKEIFELRQQQVKGFGVNALWRFLGNRSTYLVIGAYASSEDAQAAQAAGRGRGHPYSEYASAPPVTQHYAMVQRVQA